MGKGKIGKIKCKTCQRLRCKHDITPTGCRFDGNWRKPERTQIDSTVFILKGVTQQCQKCKQVKHVTDFWNDKQRKLTVLCKPCLSNHRKISAQKSKPKLKTKPKVDTFKLAYSEYMSSDKWKAKRREYWDSGILRECYVCSDPWINFKGKELHHRTYKRFGAEHLDDLVPVCVDCHQKISEAWIEEKKLPDKEQRTLWEVTDFIRDSYIS